MRLFRVLAIATTSLLLASPLAMAQSAGPAGIITIVVGAAPGGGHDGTARLLAEGLRDRFGHTVVVENRPGANGVIAGEYVAHAKPDGTTVLLASPAETVIAPIAVKAMRYDAVADLAPVTLAGTTPVMIVANPSTGIHSLADMIALAKRKPGGLAFGTPGEGSSQQLAGAWLAHLAEITLLHIPYKGAGPATNDVVAGHVPIGIVGMVPVLPFIRSGKLTAVAVTSPRRVAWLEDLPTVAETPGMEGFEASHWMGVMAPGRTPPAIVQQLQSEIAAVLKQPEMRARLTALGVDPVGNSPLQFRDFLAAERRRFVEMYKYSGLTPE